MMKWVNVVGLIFNLLGAGVIAAGVMASRASIDRVMASLCSGPNPAAQADRRRQSRFAILRLGPPVLRLPATERIDRIWMTRARSTRIDDSCSPGNQPIKH